jgi:PadR family transcriptional regulator, regulatory protein PadR
MMQVSLQTLQLLQVFMEDPSRPRYGLELAKRTGLKSGTVYPALGRLEQEGWLTSEVEDVDPKLAKRPARRIYTLTNAGMAGATAAARRYEAALPITLKERLA